MHNLFHSKPERSPGAVFLAVLVLPMLALAIRTLIA